MSTALSTIGLYSLIPGVCMLFGGTLASIYKPGDKLTSAMQHFAAGVVFAAVAKELLPEISAEHAPIALIVGFSLGVFSMLILKWLTGKLEDIEQGQAGMSWGLVSAVAIDLLLDGILIGVAFIAGSQGGILIAVALALEIFFLGLSTTATLGGRGVAVSQRLLVTLVLTVLIPMGALIGAGLLIHLPTSITAGVLAFGIAALLYLVTEELLTEAHEIRETPWITACFFAGFLLILVLEGI